MSFVIKIFNKNSKTSKPEHHNPMLTCVASNAIIYIFFIHFDMALTIIFYYSMIMQFTILVLLIQTVYEVLIYLPSHSVQIVLYEFTEYQLFHY